MIKTNERIVTNIFFKMDIGFGGILQKRLLFYNDLLFLIVSLYNVDLEASSATTSSAGAFIFFDVINNENLL